MCVWSGKLTSVDFKTLFEIVSAKVKGETQQDDKTMIMERTIQIVAGLTDHSKVQEILTNNFIGQLWNSLEHPPYLYMGDEFRFRHADGSMNVRKYLIIDVCSADGYIEPLPTKTGSGGNTVLAIRETESQNPWCTP